MIKRELSWINVKNAITTSVTLSINNTTSVINGAALATVFIWYKRIDLIYIIKSDLMWINVENAISTSVTFSNVNTTSDTCGAAYGTLGFTYKWYLR